MTAPTTQELTKLFSQLSPTAQEAFVRALAKSTKGEGTGPKVWLKWRVWFVDGKRINKKDWMYMFARSAQEAVDLSNMCRHQKLRVLDVELVP